MSERANLLSIFRAVDVAAGGLETSGLDHLAQVLPQYQGGAARGWFERFVDFDSTFAEDVPAEVDEAIAELNVEPPSATLAAKRLLAVTALIRTDPGDEGRRSALDQALSWLMPLEARTDGDRRTALFGLLENASSWNELVKSAHADALITAEVALLGLQCCQDEATSVKLAGQRFEVSILTTSFTTDAVTIEDLRDYLDPGNWPHCAPSSLWCEMTELPPLGATPTHYLEVIRVTCLPPGAWSLRTCLEFVRRDLPGGGLSLAYQQCRSGAHEPHCDQRVTVDEGSIVAFLDPHAAPPSGGANPMIRVDTTKRVAFRDLEFNAAQFAMWACALGYGEAAKTMALECARHKRHPAGVPWKPQAPASRLGHLEHWIEHASHTASAGLKAHAAAARTSLQKIADGVYTSDDWVNDTTALWSRAARDVLRVVEPCLPQPKSPGEQARPERSIDFRAAGGGTVRQLTLDGPLVNDFGDTIPAADVAILPNSLAGDQDTFCIEASVTSERAGVYRGVVRVGPQAGAQGHGGPGNPPSPATPVWLQVG